MPIMHSVSEMGVNNVPAFLSKIWALVEDPLTDELIAWDPSGMSFHVFDQARFAKEILPLYFKHNNIASFIRQLNMYGFRKVVHLESGAIKSESDDLEFHHPYFMRGQDQLLENIKRKSTTGSSLVGVKTEPGYKLKEEDVNRVLTDVQLMKGKQDTLSLRMDKMKKENEALWREVASLRQKHMKQQQIVNKLIQFMVHLVGGNPNMPGSTLSKRKLPLMINDSSQVLASKRPRFNKQLSIEELQQSNYVVSSPNSVDGDGTGPVIQEVIDPSSPMLAHNYSRPAPVNGAQEVKNTTASQMSTTTQNYSQPLSVKSGATVSTSQSQGLVVSKQPTSKSQDPLNISLDSTDLNNLLQVVDPSSISQGADPVSSSNILDKYIKDHPVQDRLFPTSSADISGQLVDIQDDLDGLKDLLSGGQYNFDANTLFSLFSNDSTGVPVSVENLLGELDKGDGMPSQYNYTVPAADVNPNTITGNELVQFQPAGDNFLSNIADLSDLIDDEPTSPGTSAQNLTIPNVSDPVEVEEIDPMSFINAATD